MRGSTVFAIFLMFCILCSIILKKTCSNDVLFKFENFLQKSLIIDGVLIDHPYFHCCTLETKHSMVLSNLFNNNNFAPY